MNRKPWKPFKDSLQLHLDENVGGLLIVQWWELMFKQNPGMAALQIPEANVENAKGKRQE